MDTSNKLSFKYLIDNAGKIRDVSLLGLAVIYGLGYVVWAMHAWFNNLGFLPVLDFQYFIAGLIPSIIVCIAFVIWKSSKWFLEEVWQKKIREAKGIWKYVPKVFWITYLVYMGVAFYLEKKYSESNVYIFIFIFLLLIPDEKIGKLNMGALSRGFIAFVYLPFLVVVSFVFYIDGYEELSQAIGGAKPRCATIDINRQNISPSTLAKIVDVNSLQDGFDVVSSVELDVFYSNDDILIVKPRVDISGAGFRTSYEIPKKDISMIFWCDN